MKLYVYKFRARTGYAGEELISEESFEEDPDSETLNEYCEHYCAEVVEMYGREEEEDIWDGAECSWKFLRVEG